uniref:Uncharacterized protein n=1 Tax=Meloidogyne enterolobii TaxID=390850 RepID=A0A6V7VE64_MELEN|nr:unnamed protein product [Meloidogyne enterolobii]
MSLKPRYFSNLFKITLVVVILSYLYVEIEIKCFLNIFIYLKVLGVRNAVVKVVKEVAQQAAKHTTREKPRIRVQATTRNVGEKQKPGNYLRENSPTEGWEPTHPVEGKMVKFSEYGNIEEQ